MEIKTNEYIWKLYEKKSHTIMLLEITVGNYLSFKEKKTLSLEASSITEFPQNITRRGDFSILKSAVIYGANSSGKSNFIKALTKMYKIVLSSAKLASTDKIGVTPFLLNTETENNPSFFEILFLIDNVRYRYGFEIDDDKVYYEWLYSFEYGQKEIRLFTRKESQIDISENFQEGDGLQNRTRINALFLSTVDQFNGELSTKIMKWFGESRTLSGIVHDNERYFTVALLNPEFGYLKDKIHEFLRSLDLGFEELLLEKDGEATSIKTVHTKYDGEGNEMSKMFFSLAENESSGTNKLFDMAGIIIAGLLLGRLVIIDELDAKLHPLLTQTIVRLFNSPESNRSGAQLVFVTHDANLLKFGNFRRDQIYFAEKDRLGATDLYSLVEFKDPKDGIKIRKDSRYEKDYIKGRYGAIPYIGDFNSLMENDR